MAEPPDHEVAAAMAQGWALEVFVADDGSVPFDRFVRALPERKFAALDAALERVLAVRGMDLARTEWLKPLGGGLHEFRVRHDAREIAHMFGTETADPKGQRERVLLRVFVHFYSRRVVLLLGGYDKGADPKPRRQQREIVAARSLLAQFRGQTRARRGHGRRG